MYIIDMHQLYTICTYVRNCCYSFKDMYRKDVMEYYIVDYQNFHRKRLFRTEFYIVQEVHVFGIYSRSSTQLP